MLWHNCRRITMSHIKAWFGIKNPNGSITAICGNGMGFNKDRIHQILSTQGNTVCNHLQNAMSNDNIGGLRHIEDNGKVKCDYKIPSMFNAANIQEWSPVVHFRDKDAYLKNIRVPSKNTHTCLYLADKDNSTWHSSDDYANGFSPCNPSSEMPSMPLADEQQEIAEDFEETTDNPYTLETDDEIDSLPDEAFYNDETLDTAAEDAPVSEDEFEDETQADDTDEEEESSEESTDVEDEEYDDLDATIDAVDFREAKAHPEYIKLIYGNAIPSTLKKR